MTTNTQQLLESLLAGNHPTPYDLDLLIAESVLEDQYLDYKNPQILNSKKKAAQVIREYVSAFANSMGGILIIGIDQRTGEITNCKAPDGGDLAEWASRCLTPIYHHFSPLPQIRVVEHASGNVLIVYTDRSLNLVPCVEEGKLAYYFRLHDQTLSAPDFLIADLILGKRRHPYLNLNKIQFGNTAFPLPISYDAYLKFDVVFMLENESFVWAEDIRLGFIGFFNEPENGKHPLGRHLLSHIDVKALENERFSQFYNLSHVVFASPKVEPFSVQTLSNNAKRFSLPIRLSYQWLTYSWKAAVYLISNQSPPIWYQVQLNVNKNLHEALESKQVISTENLLEIKRLAGTSPIVSWQDFSSSSQTE
jgi:putative hemolysin